jgi:hypothetical protein
MFVWYSDHKDLKALKALGKGPIVIKSRGFNDNYVISPQKLEGPISDFGAIKLMIKSILDKSFPEAVENDDNNN